MSHAASTSTTLLDSRRPAGHASAAWTVVRFSLAVTVLGALLAAALQLVAGTEFLLTFVFIRWGVVFALVLSPLVHRLVLARRGVRLPYALQTPLTALVLTVESICFDILSARFF